MTAVLHYLEETQGIRAENGGFSSILSHSYQRDYFLKRHNWQKNVLRHYIHDNNGVICDLRHFLKFLSHSNSRSYLKHEKDARGAKMKVTATMLLKKHIEKMSVFALPLCC
jgi:hypothetical protein